MRRTALLVVAGLICTVFAFSGSASGATTCVTASETVVGRTIEGTLTSSNVDPSQASYATCGQAKRAMKQIADARIEERGNVSGYFCGVASALKSRPPILNYTCTFKGADTATFIKLTFSVKYRPFSSCATSSPNVAGHAIEGKLSARDVNVVQARFATCDQAKRVMKRITGLGVEEPKSVAGFYCLPAVLRTEPDRVRYTCTFKGADTAMFVQVVFTVTYNLD